MSKRSSTAATEGDATPQSVLASQMSTAGRTWIVLSLLLWGTLLGLVVLFWWADRHQASSLTDGMDPATGEAAYDRGGESRRRGGQNSGAEGSADPAPHSLSAHAAAATLSGADALRERGQYQHALRAYERLAEQAQQPLSDELSFRMGLCAEALGDFDDARAHYQELAGRTPDPVVRDACRIAQARLWIAEDEYDVAVELLSDLILEPSGGTAHQSAEAVASHMLGDAMARQAMPEGHQDLFSDAGLASASVPADLGLLEMIEAARGSRSVAAGVAGELGLTRRSGDRLEQMVVSGRILRQPMTRVVEELAELSERSVHWSAAARRRSAGRSTAMSVEATDLASALDRILAPANLAWSDEGGAITIRADDEDGPDRASSVRMSYAERALETAVLRFPEDRQVARSLLTLGNLAFARSNLDRSAGYFRQVRQHHLHDRAAIKAGFNLAKVHLADGKMSAALETFLGVADAAPGSDVEPAAYLFAGRLMIDSQEIRRSVAPLLRARAMAGASDVQAIAASTLSTAYLLQGNPHAASLVLMEHRDDFASDSQQATASFLSSLARFRAARKRGRREREAEVLLEAISNVRAEDFFCSSGSLLIGQTYEDLGLRELAEEAYEAAISQLPANPLRDRLMMEAARLRERAGDASGALVLYRRIVEQEDSTYRADAFVRLGYISLEEDRSTALLLAHRALQSAENDTERVRALQLMGRTYQQEGDYSSAAMCYAGALPDQESQPIQQ